MFLSNCEYIPSWDYTISEQATNHIQNSSRLVADLTSYTHFIVLPQPTTQGLVYAAPVREESRIWRNSETTLPEKSITKNYLNPSQVPLTQVGCVTASIPVGVPWCTHAPQKILAMKNLRLHHPPTDCRLCGDTVLSNCVSEMYNLVSLSSQQLHPHADSHADSACLIIRVSTQCDWCNPPSDMCDLETPSAQAFVIRCLGRAENEVAVPPYSIRLCPR